MNIKKKWCGVKDGLVISLHVNQILTISNVPRAMKTADSDY